VTEGFAGIWIRIDPKVGFNNMHDKGIKGTTMDKIRNDPHSRP
jgi:hypothetical protein